jgi:hypothetical protein
MRTIDRRFAVDRFSLDVVCKEDRMKLLLAATILDSTSGRLACYDAAFPPKLKMPATRTDAAVRDAYVDPFVAEEARTAAKLKNICRGC